jgi:hypothetical protein
MSFQPGFAMANFESKTLNRKFDRIIFSGGVVADAKAAKAPATVGGKPFVGSKEAVIKPAGKIKVAKATGANAYTIAEVYAKAASLNNKQVVVRGKVVKVSPSIMQRNWVHIQDGTGDAKRGSHNLVFTSEQLPKVGDVVLAGGTLHKDKDFGMGYKYDVIVEDAGFRK